MTKNALLEKGPKIRAWVDPPPIFRAMPERKRFFFIDVFPYTKYYLPLIKSSPISTTLHLNPLNTKTKQTNPHPNRFHSLQEGTKLS